MNIQSLLKSMAPSRPANPSVRKTDSLIPGDEQEQVDDDSGDQIAISYHARAALSEMRNASDADVSVRSMLVKSPLTEERAAEVRERIDGGYYGQPGVLKRVARILVSVLDSQLP